MLFNSIHFFFFFLAVTLVYLSIPYRFRTAWLLLAGCYFYVNYIPAYLLILFALILVDYTAGRLIESAPLATKKAWLCLSIASNLAFLFSFKYLNFFSEVVLSVLPDRLGFQPSPNAGYAIPIGLSFHTLQSIAYIVEVFRGRQKAEKNLWTYSLYILFYPQLTAGPIERPQGLLKQLQSLPPVFPSDLKYGAQRIGIGLIKKLFFADQLSLFVNPIFSRPDHYPWWALLTATLAFTVQIYCDFSGYSDIAVGTARSMGFRLVENFQHPFGAANLKDFWRRWHISLSNWFRDYVYIPLGGSASYFIELRNIWIVFLLSGLWHGAGWNFVAWGAMHAFGVTFLRLWERIPQIPNRMISKWNRHLGIFCTFSFFMLSMIWFRTNSISEALDIYERIIFTKGAAEGSSAIELTSFASAGILILLFFLRHFLAQSCVKILDRFRHFRGPHPVVLTLFIFASLTGAIWLASSMRLLGEPKDFIYFSF